MQPLKWIEIDSEAIRSNLRWVASRLSAGARLMAVVKSNAYGHGAERVSKLAVRHGASSLGVATVDEGLELRRAGIKSPIVLLSPPLPEQARAAAQASFEVTADSTQLLNALNAVSSRSLKIHLDLDFGLRRWGAPPSRLPALVRRLKRCKKLKLAGLSTHFDYVPGENAVEAEKKLKSFSRSAAWLKERFPDAVCHAANSSIFLDFPHRQMDMVRIGNLIYGINPTSTPTPLKSPWKFYARVISLTKISKGAPIGYASEFIAPRRMALATLPVGYADGLTMEPAERLIGFGKGFQYWGRLRGRKTPFVGRCGIAHVLVDVSQVPRPRIGEPVLLPIRRTAASPRIPRVYR